MSTHPVVGYFTGWYNSTEDSNNHNPYLDTNTNCFGCDNKTIRLYKQSTSQNTIKLVMHKVYFATIHEIILFSSWNTLQNAHKT